MNRFRKNGDTDMLRAGRLALPMVGLLLPGTLSAAASAQGNPATAVTLPVGEEELTYYEEMSVRGLTVRAFAVPRPKAGKAGDFFRLQPAEYGRPAEYRRPRRYFTKEVPVSPRETNSYYLPPELEGLPALTMFHSSRGNRTIGFHLSKPARVYAYIEWDSTAHPNPAREKWRIYRADPWAPAAIYYRDFPAGRSRIQLNHNPCLGVGISPLDGLSAKERLVPFGRIREDKLVLTLDSMHASAEKATVSYEVYEPDGPRLLRDEKHLVYQGETRVTAKAKTRTDVVLGFENSLREGIMYAVDVRLSAADAVWNITVPYGRFPVPEADVSIREPVFPYGGYMKLQVNPAPEIWGRFVAATFYHFRRMGMTAAMLGKPNRTELDLARRYGIKCVISLASRHRRFHVPDDVINHPAILTYKVGDEPQIGNPKKPLSRHIKLLDETMADYPQYRPFLPTIFDSYGRGDKSDPALIYNHYLKDYDVIRAGRLYCFQKRQYGLLRPIAYKPRLEVTSVFLGLEADERPWWLIPQFHGRDKPTPVAYWRIPGGREMRALLHLAVSHRCTGILGWGVHSHRNTTGLFFDGLTMDLTYPEVIAKLAHFGRQLKAAKPVIMNFTRDLLQVHYADPWEVDVHARWLKDGRIAVYCVNRDLDRARAAVAEIYLGDSLRAEYGKGPDPKAFADEVSAVVDAFTGREVPAEYKPMENGRFGYLRLEVPEIAAGDAMLLVISGSSEAGRFSDELLPENVQSFVADQEYLPLD